MNIIISILLSKIMFYFNIIYSIKGGIFCKYIYIYAYMNILCNIYVNVNRYLKLQ